MKKKETICKRCGRILWEDREVELGYCTSGAHYCDELALQRNCEHRYKFKAVETFDDNEGRTRERNVLICVECKYVCEQAYD